MNYRDYAYMRRNLILPELEKNSPYARHKFKTPTAIFGEDWEGCVEVNAETDDWRNLLKGMLPVLFKASDIFDFEEHYAKSYVEAVLLVFEDVCQRAEEGILDVKTWFKDFAMAHKLVEKYSATKLIWADTSELSRPIADLFGVPFFNWYTSFTKTYKKVV